MQGHTPKVYHMATTNTLHQTLVVMNIALTVSSLHALYQPHLIL